MHIEPGIVEGGKILLSYGTALAALGLTAKASLTTIEKDGLVSLLLRSALATLLVFGFFEVLPHHPVGVSEVHLILGTTLFLILGLAPAAIGLIGGLLVQGVFFAPSDLPQYGMNVTTLLLPLFAMGLLAKRVISAETPYVELKYGQALKLSATYQGGIIAWVAFWAFYGQGFGAENLASIGSFGLAYLSVIVFEPLIDLAVLAAAKALHNRKGSMLVEKRLYSALEA
jgi:ABC-type Co2+ transport system permease subunit